MITYTSKQQQFIDAVKAGRSIYLTGKAGTGKSFIVREAKAWLENDRKKVIAVAPTGIAATNIDGQTIHSMFRINPHVVMNFEHCSFVSKMSKEVLKRADTVIVDEISMLRPDVLDGMHLTLKKNGLKGMEKRQIIFVGDLKQLPVILDDNTRSVLYETYNGATFLDADIIKKLDLLIIELDEVLRQDNPDFINALNNAREGIKDPYFKRFVHSEAKGVVLAPHNSTVNQYNEAGLKAQGGELFTFKAKISGDAKPNDFALENEIKVKNGCKIMYLVNSKEAPLRNGTLGTFVSHEGCHFIRVGEANYALSIYTSVKKQYKYDSSADRFELIEIGQIEQYPFKLAYALSIHKSQGLTFDECTIDLRQPCFQSGQLYVALSRVRRPEGLRIIIN